MITLSVIVPIYKAENYIERCARSLMEQTINEGVEFLFINDKTPDASMDILNTVLAEYPARKEQVRVIENERNLGVSATRKIGVREARGTYIGWCDADDWCEKDMFERMMKATQNGEKDIVVCNYYEDKDGVSRPVEWEECSSPQDCIISKHKGFFLPGSLWQQICKKGIVDKSINQIANVSYAEDVYTIILECYYARSIAYVRTELYHHTQENTSSLLHNISYTLDDWKSQKDTIDTITCVLCQGEGYIKYHVACNALKYSMKNFFRSVFPTRNIFYKEYRECYKDVNEYLFTPKKKRWKTFLVYNCYFLFWLYKL